MQSTFTVKACLDMPLRFLWIMLDSVGNSFLAQSCLQSRKALSPAAIQALGGLFPTYSRLDWCRCSWEFGIELHLLPVNLYIWLEPFCVNQRPVKASAGEGGGAEIENIKQLHRKRQRLNMEKRNVMISAVSGSKRFPRLLCIPAFVFMRQPLY